MYDKAMEKIRDEMAREHGNRNLCAFGEFMTDYLMRHPDAAEGILQEGKSLKGAWEKLVNYAKRQPRSGVCVAIADQDAYRICLEYFGLRMDASPAPAPAADAAPALEPAGDDLDSLMGW